MTFFKHTSMEGLYDDPGSWMALNIGTCGFANGSYGLLQVVDNTGRFI